MRPYVSISRILFFLFLIHLVFNLEKLIFINEVFSFIGLMYFLTKFSSVNYIEKVNFYVILMFIVFLIYSVFSFLYMSEASTYQFFRTVVFVYSIPAFFLGSYFIKSGVFNSHIIFQKFNLFFAGASVLAFLYGGRMANSVALTLFIQNAKLAKLALLLFLLGFAFIKGGGTSFVFLVSYILFLFLVRVDFFGSSVRKGITSIWFLFAIALFFFILLDYTGNYLVQATNGAIDGNSIWRIKFWSYLVSYVSHHGLITGIGFGTPIFDATNSMTQFIIAASPNDPDLPYTIGPHNSYLYVFARTGLLGSILFAIPHWLLFRKVLRHQLYKDNGVFFASFAILLCIDMAMFNVVLESPMLSSIYWIVFGMLNQYTSLANKSRIIIT